MTPTVAQSCNNINNYLDDVLGTGNSWLRRRQRWSLKVRLFSPVALKFFPLWEKSPA